MTSIRTPVIFIHGLWLHASSWAPWLELFGQAGYEPAAPGWPGDPDTVELARANPDSIANHGIDDVTNHYVKIIDTLPARPILIGHSFGGMIAEKLLGMDYGAAAIGIDAAQIKGVLPLPLSSLRATLPVFKNPANMHKAVSLTAKEFHYSFGNALSEEESNDLHERWAIPCPWQAAVRGLGRELLAALPGQGKHRQQGPRAAATHHGQAGSHGARGHHQVHAQAVPALRRRNGPGGVRPRSLPDHRLRLARGGRRVPGLAEQARPLTGRKRGERSTTGTMMALRAHARGGPEQLTYEQAPRSAAGPGEALIVLHAATITFAELTWTCRGPPATVPTVRRSYRPMRCRARRPGSVSPAWQWAVR